MSFLFDFGDGNSLELEGVYNKMLFVPYVVAQAKHYYTSGRYHCYIALFVVCPNRCVNVADTCLITIFCIVSCS